MRSTRIGQIARLHARDSGACMGHACKLSTQGLTEEEHAKRPRGGRTWSRRMAPCFCMMPTQSGSLHVFRIAPSANMIVDGLSEKRWGTRCWTPSAVWKAACTSTESAARLPRTSMAV